MRGLVTLGPALRPEEVAGAPDVAVVPRAPHRELLPQAAVVVTHGGHGTVLKALAAGVPMVVLPHGRDQGDNAVRVAALGAGLRMSRRAEPAAIGAAVRRVLVEAPFRQRAREQAEVLAAESARGPGAVDAVEELLPVPG